MSGSARQPTPRQLEVYRFIRDYVRRRGVPPSVQEIAEAFDFNSPNAAQRHLAALQACGLIERERGRTRALRLPLDGRQSLPIVGAIPAGPLSEAVADMQGRLDFGDIAKGDNVAAFRVADDSMLDQGIKRGDYVLAEFIDGTMGPIVAVVRRID